MAGDTAGEPRRDNALATGSHDQETVVKAQAPPFLSRLLYASVMYGLKGLAAGALWRRSRKESRKPPKERPNIVKTYECRPALPVRIFFPSSYDQTSPTTLPTLFTIHGGGFCLGHNSDDDEWNRTFADRHDVLVVSLNYSKAPACPFPAAPHDVEALLLAVLADESLPIDRTGTNAAPGSGTGSESGARTPGLSRTAILGFSAGGNLALSVSQLPSVRAHPLGPAAAVSVYGPLDLSVPPREKLANRPWKQPGGRDPLAGLAPAFDWSYIPYGQDLCDPLLSPHYAARDRLPAYVCLIASELDMLAHESWRAACRFSAAAAAATGAGVGAGNSTARVVPDRTSADEAWRVCGRPGQASAGKGELVLRGDERFAFEEESGRGGSDGGRGGVKWLLVPDVQHGFDNPHMRALLGAKEAIEDAVLKTEAYTAELARWLKEVVWRVQ